MAVDCQPDRHYGAYFTEVQDIEDHCVVDSQDDENAAADDGENSAGFLIDLGVKIEDITLFEVSESSKLGDVPLTPAQRATLRRHVERVQTTLRPHSKQRADVRQLFHKHKPGTDEQTSKSEDENKKQRDDSETHFVTDGSAMSLIQSIHPAQKHAVVPDTPAEEYITPDYSMSQPVMSRPPGGSSNRSPYELHCSPVILCDSAERGVTQVDDLGKKDQKILTTLAHLELMMLFDESSITYNRKKSRRKGSDHGVFNVTLQTLLDKDRKKCPHLKVPLVFQELVQYLEKNGLLVEGLLRVSGRLTRIKELREKIDSHYSKGKPVTFDNVAQHDAAALLKLFLRELPEPLLTSERVNAFIQVDSIVDVQKQLYALNMLILVLPEVNRNVLLVLLVFLDKVVKEPANMMSAENIAMVMAPNLFLMSSGSRSRSQEMNRELKLAAATSKITQLLLANWSHLWMVPSALVSQIRQKHEDSASSNPIMRLLGYKDKADARNPIGAGSKLDINVKVDNTGADVKVSITSATTAGDVVEMLTQSPLQIQQRRPIGQHVSPESVTSNCCLYEVGGNIGERRLDCGTNMMNVCQVNRNAKFVIRYQAE